MDPKQGKSLRPGYLVALAGLVLLTAGLVMLAKPSPAQAVSSYLTQARTQYPGIKGTALDSCAQCHPAGGYTLNPYAQDFANHGHSFTAIESLDSDRDGATNLQEINGLTLPGDPASKPSSAPTATPARTATRTPTATATARPGTTATATGTPTSTATATRTPTATPTARPGATATPKPAATPTAGVPLPSPTPAPVSRRMAFVGTVGNLPAGGNHVGTWRVLEHSVRVSSTTYIEQAQLLGGEESHALVWILGTRSSDGSTVAFYIRVLQGGNSGERPASGDGG